MRSSCVLALLAAFCVVLSGPARAGDFGPPVNSNACGEADVAGDAMGDPTTAYIFAETPELCEKLCTRAGKLCRVYVNDVFACYFRVLSNGLTFGKLNCESATNTSQDAKLCKQNNAEVVSGLVSLVKGERLSSLADCVTWADTCRAACTP